MGQIPMPKRPVNIVVETGSLAGGVRVIGEIANRLVQRDWEVSIWSINPQETMSWFPLSRKVQWHSFFVTGSVRDYAQLAVVLGKQKGIKMATFWRTAYTVLDAGDPDERFYLVQDVETSYTSQPVQAKAVTDTYEADIHKFTTSRWVESQLPNTDYIGIGLDNYWKEQSRWKRLGYPLACARRQSLKGWTELCETARYLAVEGLPLVTYGLDKRSPMIASHHHNLDPRSMKPKGDKLDDSQLRLHYSQAGTFVSTSRHEGFSLTPLEAMACGCPVVMTPADGNMEYAEPGDNCLMADTPRGIADAVLNANADAELWKRLSLAGPKTAARYRWSEVIDRLEKVLS